MTEFNSWLSQSEHLTIDSQEVMQAISSMPICLLQKPSRQYLTAVVYGIHVFKKSFQKQNIKGPNIFGKCCKVNLLL